MPTLELKRRVVSPQVLYNRKIMKDKNMITRKVKMARDINTALSLYQKFREGKKKIWWFERQMMLIRKRYSSYPEVIEEVFIRQQAERGIFVT